MFDPEIATAEARGVLDKPRAASFRGESEDIMGLRCEKKAAGRIGKRSVRPADELNL